MAWLRHASRHVLASLVNEMQARLDDLDWTSVDDLPFGPLNAAVVEIIDYPINEGETLRSDLTAGMVAINLGTELPVEDQELGGPLVMQEIPIFIDIFQPTHAAALALATDVRDILLGRVPGSKRYMDVVDQITGDVEEGWRVSFEDVTRDQPTAKTVLHWQVVKARAQVYFPEVQY